MGLSTGLGVSGDTGDGVPDARGAAPQQGEHTDHIATRNRPGPGTDSSRSRSERTYVLLPPAMAFKPSKSERHVQKVSRKGGSDPEFQGGRSDGQEGRGHEGCT